MSTRRFGSTCASVLLVLALSSVCVLAQDPPGAPAAPAAPATPPAPAAPVAPAGTLPHATVQTEKGEILVGEVTREDVLKLEPAWQDSQQAYRPDSSAVAILAAADRPVAIKVIFGTWCSDSRREVPRFWKILERAHNPNLQLEMIAVGRKSNEPTDVVLYDPALEKDSCGVGFIADIKGKKSHQIVKDGLAILLNLEHRGAVGADPRMGDGAGILVQIPHAFFKRKAAEIGFELPEPGEYAIGALFMPRDTAWRNVIKSIIADQIKEEGLTLLGWRDVPTDNEGLSERTKEVEPVIRQVFVGRGSRGVDQDALERKLYIIRKTASAAIQALNGRWPDVTANVGVFQAGTRPNIVPDLAELQVDVRGMTKASLEAALATVREIAAEPGVPDVTTEIETMASWLPMEKLDRRALAHLVTD